MITATTVLGCALEILGRPSTTLPPIELVTRPWNVAIDVEAFIRRDGGVIYIITDSGLFERARFSDCRVGKALIKIASIIAHEEWHVRHGSGERGAYQAQLDTLFVLGALPDSALYLSVQRSMIRVLGRQSTDRPDRRSIRRRCALLRFRTHGQSGNKATRAVVVHLRAKCGLPRRLT